MEGAVALERYSKAKPCGPTVLWDLLAQLAEGQLASCAHCIQFFYPQSAYAAHLFLDALTVAGLVDKRRVRDVVETPLDDANDEIMYVSPSRLTTARSRQKQERAAKHIDVGLKAYRAFRGQYSDSDIDRGYARLLEKTRLRETVAHARKDIAMSPIAKIRLMLEYYQKMESKSLQLAKRQIEERLKDTSPFEKPDVDVALAEAHDDLEGMVVGVLSSAPPDERYKTALETLESKFGKGTPAAAAYEMATRHASHLATQLGETALTRFAVKITESLSRTPNNPLLDAWECYLDSLRGQLHCSGDAAVLDSEHDANAGSVVPKETIWQPATSRMEK